MSPGTPQKSCIITGIGYDLFLGAHDNEACGTT